MNADIEQNANRIGPWEYDGRCRDCVLIHIGWSGLQFILIDWYRRASTDHRKWNQRSRFDPSAYLRAGIDKFVSQDLLSDRSKVPFSSEQNEQDI